jgi:glycosyltransferase involved in cell wall biosynthesis
MQAFPRGRSLRAAGGTDEVAGARVRFLPYLNVQPLKPLTAGLSLLAALLAWRWRTRGAGRRLIHCMNLHMPPGPFALLAARLTGSRITASVMDVFQPGVNVPDQWKWRVDYRLHRWVIPRLDGLMVVSPAIAEDLAGRRPVCHLEGGVGRRSAAALPRPPRPPGAPFAMAFAGSLEPINCIGFMLDAMEHLPGPGFRLLVAGDGSLARLVRERAARDARIDYRGLLGFDDVRAMYAEADALLCVRRTGGRREYFFPSKLMEYLASGVPVVATRIRGVEEELGDRVVLLREETPAALAALVRGLASAPREEREALGRRGREHVLAHKTWEAQGRKLAAFLLEVTGR